MISDNITLRLYATETVKAIYRDVFRRSISVENVPAFLDTHIQQEEDSNPFFNPDWVDWDEVGEYMVKYPEYLADYRRRKNINNQTE